MAKQWTRTCQSCGHEQKDKEPSTQGVFTKAYEYRKCKKCGSESLDYGSEQIIPPYTEVELAYIKSLESEE